MSIRPALVVESADRMREDGGVGGEGLSMWRIRVSLAPRCIAHDSAEYSGERLTV
jgi:hypothetical protein